MREITHGVFDSFSGAASDLPCGRRTDGDVLDALARSPRVSTWDMGEHEWLRGSIRELKQRVLIVEVPEPYPWHRYELTDAGHAALRPAAHSAAAGKE